MKFSQAVLVLLAAGALSAETMVEYSSEARFQLDVKVPDAVLQARLGQNRFQAQGVFELLGDIDQDRILAFEIRRVLPHDRLLRGLPQ